jgi:hypothetical protein
MKRYIISTLYKGQQITKSACAKNVKDASKLLEVNQYTLNKYGYKLKIVNPFDGVIAYFDSGLLWEKEKGLIGVKMTLEELKKLIDLHKKEMYYK